MKITKQYLAYLMLQENEWNTPTENPDSFDIQKFEDLIGKLQGVDVFKGLRHGLQPSLYHIYIKNALGDYMGRPNTMNNKGEKSVGFDQFKKDLKILKKRLKFVRKIKDKLPDHFYTKIKNGDDEPATGDAGGM